MSLVAYGSDSDDDKPGAQAPDKTEAVQAQSAASPVKPAAAQIAATAPDTSNSGTPAAATKPAPAKKKLPSAALVLSAGKGSASFLSKEKKGPLELAAIDKKESDAAGAAEGEASKSGKRKHSEVGGDDAESGPAAGEDTETVDDLNPAAVGKPAGVNMLPADASGKRAKVGPAGVPVPVGKGRKPTNQPSWIKEKEKAKRKIGQSVMQRWKTDAEMALRQNYDS